MYKEDAIHAHDNFIGKVNSFDSKYKRTTLITKDISTLLQSGAPITETIPDRLAYKKLSVSVYLHGQVQIGHKQWDVYELPDEHIFLHSKELQTIDTSPSGQVPIEIGKLIKENEKSPLANSLDSNLLQEK